MIDGSLGRANNNNKARLEFNNRDKEVNNKNKKVNNNRNRF